MKIKPNTKTDTFGWYLEFIHADGSGKSVLVPRDDEITRASQAQARAIQEHDDITNDEFFMSRPVTETGFNKIAEGFANGTFDPDQML